MPQTGIAVSTLQALFAVVPTMEGQRGHMDTRADSELTWLLVLLDGRLCMKRCKSPRPPARLMLLTSAWNCQYCTTGE